MGTQSRRPISLPKISEPESEPLLSIGYPSARLLSLPSDPSSGATSHIRKIGKSYRHAKTIDILPDNVLLEIFDFCRMDCQHILRPMPKWPLLVHVCQRWRQIIFASPRRLDLHILCTPGTPVRKSLGIWPAFPIVVDYRSISMTLARNDEDNVIATLEHLDRVRNFMLQITGSQWESIAWLMEAPFPVLTRLDIFSEDEDVPVIPADFLGGSAPSLQSIRLDGISYPALPTLLLSTSDLVALNLSNIPPTGYFSPEAMVVALAALPRLKIFDIEFQFATHRPDPIHPPPVSRVVLPALTTFQFTGTSDYLEGLVAPIDSPQLGWVSIWYLNQPDPQVAQLAKFIDRSVAPESTPFKHARVTFSSDRVSIDMCEVEYPDFDRRNASTSIPCQRNNWQVLHIAQVLSQFSVTLSAVAHLEIRDYLEEGLEEDLEEDHQLEGTDDVEWLHLLRQFSTVRTLYVSGDLAGNIALAMEDITGEMVTKVLPSLNLICLEGLPASFVEKFVAARQLSGRPVTVVETKTEFKRLVGSYVDE